MRWFAIPLLVFAVVARAEDVSVQTFCRLLPAYQAPAGVDYQAGVDARGKPVAPADIGARLNAAALPVEIPIELDLAARFQLNLPADMRLLPTVATLTIYPDGRVQYNGQDVSAQAKTLCDTPQNAAAPVKSDGQPPSQPVKLGSQIDGKYP